jgi:hypothetical protein
MTVVPVAASSDPQVSGALACGLREVVAEMVGRPAIDRALERVPADARATYTGALPVGWVPIRVMEMVFKEIAAEAGTNVADLHTRVARTSIERTFRRFLRMLLKITTDQALVSRTPVIFARSYDCGRLEAKIPEPGRGVITLLDWPDAPDWPLRATRVGIESVLSIAGRRDVRVSCSRTSTGAIFFANWK